LNHNEYVPFLSEIKDIIKHTDIEFTFRVSYIGDIKPGQFFQVSIPKFGEAPISVSGITENTIDLTIRRVGKVTNEIFEYSIGSKLFLRGPYGNGFDLNDYKGKELLVIAGGTGLSPVKAVIDYFSINKNQVKDMTLIAGFKSPEDILFSDDFISWNENMDVILTVDIAENSTDYNIGRVTKYIPELDFENISEAVAIVVGPPLMMKFTTLELISKGFKEENIWISHERKMCCAIGKCGHCKIDDVYVCLEGPVFNYVKGKKLID
jgi:anaerobic sulfite reductase subunit B